MFYFKLIESNEILKKVDVNQADSILIKNIEEKLNNSYMDADHPNLTSSSINYESKLSYKYYINCFKMNHINQNQNRRLTQDALQA